MRSAFRAWPWLAVTVIPGQQLQRQLVLSMSALEISKKDKVSPYALYFSQQLGINEFVVSFLFRCWSVSGVFSQCPC